MRAFAVTLASCIFLGRICKRFADGGGPSGYRPGKRAAAAGPE
jgi:hypothetical protein